MAAKLIGLALIGLPALFVGALVLWRCHRPVFFFFLALLAVGLGYLATTPTPDEIAQALFGSFIGVPTPAQ